MIADMKPSLRDMLYLTEEQARDIKLRAKRQNKREAEVIRELVSQGLKAAPPARQESTRASLLRLAAIDGKGPADLSTRIDDYLYGEES